MSPCLGTLTLKKSMYKNGERGKNEYDPSHFYNILAVHMFASFTNLQSTVSEYFLKVPNSRFSLHSSMCHSECTNVCVTRTSKESSISQHCDNYLVKSSLDVCIKTGIIL